MVRLIDIVIFIVITLSAYNTADDVGIFFCFDSSIKLSHYLIFNLVVD